MLYLSGPITSEDPEIQKKNLQRFFELEKELGVPCYNPARNGDGGDKPYEYYMAMDVIWIIQNKPKMFMMKWWEESRGARLEHEIAQQLELDIEYEL